METEIQVLVFILCFYCLLISYEIAGTWRDKEVRLEKIHCVIETDPSPGRLEERLGIEIVNSIAHGSGLLGARSSFSFSHCNIDDNALQEQRILGKMVYVFLAYIFLYLEAIAII